MIRRLKQNWINRGADLMPSSDKPMSTRFGFRPFDLDHLEYAEHFPSSLFVMAFGALISQVGATSLASILLCKVCMAWPHSKQIQFKDKSLTISETEKAEK